MSTRTCIVCSAEFEGKTSGKYCSKECYNKFIRSKYAKDTTTKNCKQCGTAFEGKRQERNCPDCGRTHTLDESLQYEQRLICRRCGDLIGTRLVYRTRGYYPTKEAQHLCATCAKVAEETFAERARQRMLSDDNPAKINRKHPPKVPRTRAEWLAETSQRMRENNPMHNPEVAARVGQSLKAHWKEHEPVRGEKHHRWKGDRDRAQTIRTRLYKVWTFPILQRDNFTCQGCGVHGGRLEVHHTTRMFRDILADVLDGRSLSTLSQEDFEVVSDTVVASHADCDGDTLCVACHKLKDKLRH